MQPCKLDKARSQIRPSKLNITILTLTLTAQTLDVSCQLDIAIATSLLDALLDTSPASPMCSGTATSFVAL